MNRIILTESVIFKSKLSRLKHCYWTLVTDEGNPQKIGLLHGQKTGHLLIYCNRKIMTVDFKVLDSKVYSFFVNDELCEIHLTRKGDKMFYEFQINKEADTPRNRARKKLEKKHWGQTLMFFGGMILLLVGFFMGMKYYKTQVPKDNVEALLVSKGIKTVGTVFTENSKTSYLYIVENISHSTNLDLKNSLEKNLKPLFPLESGDEFLVEYIPSNPEINKIFFDRPTEKQVQTYLKRTLTQHQKLNPDLPHAKVRCEVEIAFELKGIKGLADFFFQNVPPEKNPNNNQNTYLRLIRDLPFQKKVVAECWD